MNPGDEWTEADQIARDKAELSRLKAERKRYNEHAKSFGMTSMIRNKLSILRSEIEQIAKKYRKPKFRSVELVPYETRDGIICPSCKGRGYGGGLDDFSHPRYMDTCVTCGGDGRVKVGVGR